MDITNWSGHIRMGGSFPSTIDVAPTNQHEEAGVMGVVFLYGPQRVELRRDKDNNRVALITYKYVDMDIPEGWEDSELLWENPQLPDEESEE